MDRPVRRPMISVDMKTATEQSLYAGMKSEQDREGPPPGFRCP